MMRTADPTMSLSDVISPDIDLELEDVAALEASLAAESAQVPCRSLLGGALSPAPDAGNGAATAGAIHPDR